LLGHEIPGQQTRQNQATEVQVWLFHEGYWSVVRRFQSGIQSGHCQNGPKTHGKSSDGAW
jgi:hypothetical protein